MELKVSYKKEYRIIITDFIRTKVKETGAAGVVLGLSGGVDSAVVAALALEALGKERVHCLIMPYDTTVEKEAVNDALLMVEEFHLSGEVVPIEKGVNAVFDAINEDTHKEMRRKAEGNVKARLRMVMLYYYANLHNYLVLGTSNKSELLVGYFTKYGDGGTDAMPIGDLYKTQVFSLSEELRIPDKIREKSPSAGLFEGQSDEKELGIRYSELDRILYGIEQRLSLAEISEITGIPLETVERVQRMVYSAAHKRFLGMIPKLGIRTPGYDWRENVSFLPFSHKSF